MIKVLALVLAASIVLIARSAQAAPLDLYRWKARPVIVFGSEDNSTFREQLGLLNRASSGLRERDMALIAVSIAAAGRSCGEPTTSRRVNSRWCLSARTAA